MVAEQRCTCRVHFPGRFHTNEAVGTALARCTQCSLCRPLGNDTPQKTDPLPQTLLGRPRLCAPRWPVTSVWESIDKVSWNSPLDIDFSRYERGEPRTRSHQIFAIFDLFRLCAFFGHRGDRLLRILLSFLFLPRWKHCWMRNCTIELICIFYRIFFELLFSDVVRCI